LLAGNGGTPGDAIRPAASTGLFTGSALKDADNQVRSSNTLRRGEVNPPGTRIIL
jgi:hypothetical protein